jgi:hypothetical protein
MQAHVINHSAALTELTNDEAVARPSKLAERCDIAVGLHEKINSK